MHFGSFLAVVFIAVHKNTIAGAFGRRNEPETITVTELSTTTRFRTSSPRGSTPRPKIVFPTAQTITDLTSTSHQAQETTGNSSKTTDENENSKGTSRSKKNCAVYGVVSGLSCLLMFGVGVFLFKRRKKRLIRASKAESKELENGKEGLDDGEPHIHATLGKNNVTFSYILETTAENLGQPAESSTDVLESPIYDILEATYATAGEIISENADSTTLPEIKTSNADDSTDKGDNPYPSGSGNFETSFLEQIYTCLDANQSEESNVYASLRNPKESEEKRFSEALSDLPGMESTDQDYVFF